MTKTTISLPDGLMRRVEEQAQLEGVAVADVLRIAIEAGLAIPSSPRSPSNAETPRDSIFAAEFTFTDDLPADVSEKVSPYSTDLAVERHEQGRHP